MDLAAETDALQSGCHMVTVSRSSNLGVQTSWPPGPPIVRAYPGAASTPGGLRRHLASLA
jgi:hypothetical protein